MKEVEINYSAHAMLVMGCLPWTKCRRKHQSMHLICIMNILQTFISKVSHFPILQNWPCLVSTLANG